MKMRNYQEEAHECTLAALEKVDSALLVLATGLGKTVLASHLVDDFVKKGRVMWVAHREELITQAQNSMEIITGHKADVEMGDQWATGGFLKSKIVVSTIQTQNAGREEKRMTRFDPDDFSLLVIDEAHHGISVSYGAVIDYYQQNPNLKVLGLTATPDRHDEKAMGLRFDEVAYEYNIRDGIDDGWLVPIEQTSVFVDSLDYSQIKAQAGDLNGKELAAVLEFEENIHEMAEPTVKLTGDKKTVVFCATVAQAERFAEIINRHKPLSARYVCGKTPKEIRRDMFRDFAEKKFQYLLNVAVLTEGFDDPGIEVIVLARPTRSRSLYTQMVGRGTRALPGIVDLYDDPVERRDAINASAKRSIEVIDFVGNAGRHKLITTADILGGNFEEDVIELANKNAAEKSAASGKPADVATELQQAEREIARRRAADREALWRDKIKLRAKFSTAKINPFDVLDLNPVKVSSWNKEKPPSMKQLEFLKQKGVDTKGMNWQHARQTIDQLYKRQKDGKPTYKQTKQLYKRGIDTTKITFEVAGKMMGELAMNRWQIPHSWKKLDCFIGDK